MRKSIRMIALALALVLLAACGSAPVDAEEAAQIAADYIRAERPEYGTNLELVECSFHEYEEFSCWFVDYSYGRERWMCRTSVNAETGEVMDFGIYK